MDFDASASTWMSLPWPAVTLTFDLQNLIRSSVGVNEYSHQGCRVRVTRVWILAQGWSQSPNFLNPRIGVLSKNKTASWSRESHKKWGLHIPDSQSVLWKLFKPFRRYCRISYKWMNTKTDSPETKCLQSSPTWSSGECIKTVKPLKTRTSRKSENHRLCTVWVLLLERQQKNAVCPLSTVSWWDDEVQWLIWS